MPRLIDLPLNMNNFVLLGCEEPIMLFQANLHASWWYPMLPNPNPNVCGFGCISTKLCHGISFGTSLVDTVYQLSSLFTILVHIRCQVCVYGPQILCSVAIFLPVHVLQSPDAICTLDLVLTCCVTCSWAPQGSGECVCHFRFTKYAQSPMCSE